MTTDPIALPPKPVTTYVIGVQSDGYSDDRLHDRAAYDDDQLDAYAREAVRLDRAGRVGADVAAAKKAVRLAGHRLADLRIMATRNRAMHNEVADAFASFHDSIDALAAAPSTPPDEATSRDAEAFALGMAARMRAAGMASLLAEVLAQNAARDLDDDLKERMDRAIADQDAARTQGDAA